MVASKQTTKGGGGATKHASGPKDQQATNPQRENKQEHGKKPRSKQTSTDLKHKHVAKQTHA